MTPTLSRSDAALLKAISDEQCYIEHFLFLRSDDTVIAWAIAIQVRQRGRKAPVSVPSHYGEPTAPKRIFGIGQKRIY